MIEQRVSISFVDREKGTRSFLLPSFDIKAVDVKIPMQDVETLLQGNFSNPPAQDKILLNFIFYSSLRSCARLIPPVTSPHLCGEWMVPVLHVRFRKSHPCRQPRVRHPSSTCHGQQNHDDPLSRAGTVFTPSRSGISTQRHLEKIRKTGVFGASEEQTGIRSFNPRCFTPSNGKYSGDEHYSY